MEDKTGDLRVYVPVICVAIPSNSEGFLSNVYLSKLALR